MSLQSFVINNFRNLHTIEIDLSSNFNILSGDNGAGKTNFLEALHYFATGHSFRSHLITPLIQDNQEQFTLHSKILHDHSIISAGIRRSRQNTQEIHLNGQKIASIGEIAQLLPLQLLNHDSYEILTGGPKFRRQLLDWGVFHVEHLPLSTWKKLQRALQQRNALLKSNINLEQIPIWNQEIIEAGTILEQNRAAYFQKLIPTLHVFFQQLINTIDVQIEYYPGWDQTNNLQTTLEKYFNYDRQYGCTHYGPHRADLRLTANGVPLYNVLSRGQQKLFLLALRLAQCALLKEIQEKNCLLLIDDLTAELDIQKQQGAILALSNMKTQTIITGIDNANLVSALKNQTITPKMFHVEHGTIAMINN
jgi:DNA replication and repair protein RecF